jgi:hypothetical protein
MNGRKEMIMLLQKGRKIIIGALRKERKCWRNIDRKRKDE